MLTVNACEELLLFQLGFPLERTKIVAAPLDEHSVNLAPQRLAQEGNVLGIELRLQ